MNHPQLISSMTTGLACCCGLAGACTDLRSRRIPNLLTGPAMVVGLLLHLAAGGWKGCTGSLLALLLCGSIFFAFHLAGGMGAGDVKLIAAEACLLGLPNAASLLLCTAISGGVLALALAVRAGKLKQTLANVLVLTMHHRRHGLRAHPELNVLNNNALRLPYALAIASGCFLTVFLPSFAGSGL